MSAYTGDDTPIQNYRHESGNHGERIARLESDVFNITQLLSGDVHDKLATLQSGVDTIKTILGDGHVLFAKLEDAHAANARDIAEMKAAKSGFWLHLIYPAAAAALVLWIQSHFSKGAP